VTATALYAMNARRLLQSFDNMGEQALLNLMPVRSARPLANKKIAITPLLCS